MATLKDLARALDLSVMAVSKALRDAPDISPKTKERVLAEARRQHYVPNRTAQNLRLRKSQLLGVILPNINNHYYSNIVWGIERQAEAIGFQIVLGHSLDRSDAEMDEVRKMHARQVQGLFLVPAVRWQHRLATLDLLKETSIPVVMLDRYPAGAERYNRVTWVVARDYLGSETATTYLLEQGHREILFLSGPHGGSSSAARFSGYQHAMAASPLGYRDSRVYMAGEDIESGRKAMAQALSEKTVCTAVVAFNDNVAIGAIEVLEQQGYHIPRDISIIGFGDGLLAANFRSGLSTMRIPQIDMGTTAVHQMKDLLAGRKIEPRELPVELILRHTTAKVPQPVAETH
jgi:DNA-binding LacI/PurR family transcriptional regulator